MDHSNHHEPSCVRAPGGKLTARPLPIRPRGGGDPGTNSSVRRSRGRTESPCSDPADAGPAGRTRRQRGLSPNGARSPRAGRRRGPQSGVEPTAAARPPRHLRPASRGAAAGPGASRPVADGCAGGAALPRPGAARGRKSLQPRGRFTLAGRCPPRGKRPARGPGEGAPCSASRRISYGLAPGSPPHRGPGRRSPGQFSGRSPNTGRWVPARAYSQVF
jgi:hypothetical protein